MCIYKKIINKGYTCFNKKLSFKEQQWLFVNIYNILQSNIWYKNTLVANETVDHSDVVGALPVSPAPTTSSLSTYICLQWIPQPQLQDKLKNI